MVHHDAIKFVGFISFYPRFVNEIIILVAFISMKQYYSFVTVHMLDSILVTGTVGEHPNSSVDGFD